MYYIVGKVPKKCRYRKKKYFNEKYMKYHCIVKIRCFNGYLYNYSTSTLLPLMISLVISTNVIRYLIIKKVLTLNLINIPLLSTSQLNDINKQYDTTTTQRAYCSIDSYILDMCVSKLNSTATNEC